MFSLLRNSSRRILSSYSLKSYNFYSFNNNYSINNNSINYLRLFSTPVGVEKPDRISILGKTVRTCNDLNLRLSTCLNFKEPGVALRIFEQARRERLPFNDLSVEYTVYNLCLHKQFKHAETLLESYKKEERLTPSTKAYQFILNGYAKSGDFKNVQNVLYQMERYEVPITEETYEQILLNGELYFLSHDFSNPKNFKEYVRFFKRKEKSKTKQIYSNIISNEYNGEDFNTFVKNQQLKKEENNEKLNSNDSIDNKTSVSSSNNNSLAAKIAGVIDFSKKSSLFNDKKSNSDDDSDELYFTDIEDTGFKNLSNYDPNNYKYSYLLDCIDSLFNSVSENEEKKKEILRYKEEEKEDLGEFRDNIGHYYIPDILDEDTNFTRRVDITADDDRDTKICELTGVPMLDDGSIKKNDYNIPFMDNTYTYAMDTSYQYLKPKKQLINDLFSLENEIRRGNGVLNTFPKQEFSLSYDRHAILGRSMLSMIGEDNMMPNSHFFAAIINGYGRGGEIDAMEQSFNEMLIFGSILTPQVIDNLIAGYARNLCMDKLEYTLDDIDNKLHTLSTTTLQALLFAYGRTKLYENANKVRDILLERSKTDSSIINPNYESSILYTHALENNDHLIQEAKNIRLKENKPFTIQTYDSIISAYARRKKYDKVIEYYNDIPDNLHKTENILQLAFKSFKKKDDFHNMIKCLWELRYYGFSPLNAKQIEYIIEFLCKHGQFSSATALLNKYKSIPSLIRPRIFSILLRELFKKGEKLSIIRSFDEIYKWPSYIGFIMLFSHEAQQQSKPILHIIESKNYKITEDILEAVIYYYHQKNEITLLKEIHSLVLSSYNNLVRSPNYYLWLLYSSCKHQKLHFTKKIFTEIKENGITLEELFTFANTKLSKSHYLEFCQHIHRETKIVVPAYIDEITPKEKTITDYFD